MVIASKTGWTEDFIRWQLPLRRGLAYYHAARLMEGERCRWPGRKIEVKQWADDLAKKIKEAITASHHDNEG